MPPSLRVVERELQVYRRLWRNTAFTTFVQPLLYLGAMGLGLGSIVDRRGRVEGLTYLVFVAPGLLAATAMQVAAGEALWPVLSGVKWMRFWHATVATPVGAGAVFDGFVIWTALRSGLSAAVFLGVAAAFGGVPDVWGLVAVPAAVLGAVAVAAPLGAFAATQDTDASFPVIMRVGVLPLFLFSGTFFPLRQLPAAVRSLAWLSPLWHSVELVRGATTGEAPPHAVAHVVILVVMVGCSAWWGRRTFAGRLAR